MAAGIIFALIVVVAIPVGFLMSTSIAAGAIGALMNLNANRRDPDNELIDTNY